jgi:hypothetical protein
LTTTGVSQATETLLDRWFTCVAAEALLFPDVGSPVELETVAVFEIEPEAGRLETVATILILATAPAPNVPRFVGLP